MPHDQACADDPMLLAGCAFPDEPGGMERMAEAVADEYARFGHGREQLVQMFREPFFRMTHAVWLRKGDAWCVALAERAAARWRRS